MVLPEAVDAVTAEVRRFTGGRAGSFMPLKVDVGVGAHWDERTKDGAWSFRLPGSEVVGRAAPPGP